MSPLGSRLLVALAGLAIGAAFLWLAFRGTPPALVSGILARADWGLPAAEAVIATAAFALAKAARWRLLLGAPAGLGTAFLLRPVLAGLALNALLPHSGELVRAFGLNRAAGLAPGAVLSSIVAERVFDLFAVLILGGGALGLVDLGGAIASAVRLVGVIAAAFALLILLALRYPAVPQHLVALLARRLPARVAGGLTRQATAALEGLEPVRSPRTALLVLGWSLAQWLAVAVMVHGCGGVVHLALGAAACCLVVVGIVVAFLLPNAPGYAGSVQVAFLIVLGPLGLPDAPALAASVVYQLLVVVPLIIAGVACLQGTLRRR